MTLDQARAPRGARALVLAVLAALGLVLAAALPAAAAGPVKLFDPGVSARTATSGTAIRFDVTYRNQTGEPASLVTVTIGGRSYPMQPSSDATKTRDGVRYETRIKPAVGTAKVDYAATDAKGRQASVAGGTITVTKATPASSSGGGPAPTPAPAGDPAPAPPPSVSDGGQPATTGPLPPAGPDAGWTLPIRIDGGPGAPAGDQAGPLPYAAPDGAPDGPAPDDTASAPSGVVGGARVDGAAAGAPGSGGQRRDLSAAIGASAALVVPTWTPAQALVGVAVTTTGGMAMAMAFLVFGKRRRDGEPTADDETLGAAAAASAMAATVAAVLPGDAVPPPPTLPVDAELSIPRWRRASLLEARKADPIRAPLGPVVSMTFEHGTVAPLEGHECRTIRYRVVRLLDRPDELIAQEVGVLDQGDEVQLIERSGPYWLVLCPDGRRGWLHRMTLGDVAVPSEPMPGPAVQAAAQGWDDPYGGRLASVGAGVASTAAAHGRPSPERLGVSAPARDELGDAPEEPPADDVDPDVLEAFLRSIGRA